MKVNTVKGLLFTHWRCLSESGPRKLEQIKADLEQGIDLYLLAVDEGKSWFDAIQETFYGEVLLGRGQAPLFVCLKA